MLLEVKNLSLKRSEKTILQSINLSVNQGELMVLLGGNGAGKSTLLHALAGDLPYQKGSIIFKQKKITNWQKKELAAHRAVLLQSTSLYFSSTLLDIVLMGRYPFRDNPKNTTIALEALALVGLQDRANHDIQALSGGQQQRVHIARVLAQVWESTPSNPKIIFLDEPTASLDIHYQHLLLQLLQQKTKKNELTAVVVLHDMNLAAQYASRIALLHNSHIIATGTPTQVLTPEWIKQVFEVQAFVQPHPTYPCIQLSFTH